MVASVFPSMTNAREIVSRCLENDAAAQKLLYEYYAPQMLNICYRYTKNSQEASDILQEGFVRMFRSIDQWKEQGELGVWIRKIMVNTAIIWLRDIKSIQWKGDEGSHGTINSLSLQAPIRTMEATILVDTIRQLPRGYQTVFNLYTIEGYGHAEIAKLLNISEETSRSEYALAQKQLAELMDQTQPVKP